MKLFSNSLLFLLVLIFFQLPMNAQKFAKNRVVAHRGAWKSDSLPQNSLASLQKAFSLGVTGSEFDIYLTVDSILVINHDPVFNGLVIEKSTYEDLARYPLKNGEKIPTFESFLKAGVRQKKTMLFAELKKSAIDDQHTLVTARKIVEMVQRLHAEPWMVYISFDYNALKEILMINPKAQTMYLGGDVTPEKLASDKIWGADYQAKVYDNDTSLIDNLKKQHLKINVWTVDNPKKLDYFISKDLDYYTTNEPETALEKVKVKRK